MVDVPNEPAPWQSVSVWSKKKKFYCLQPMRTFRSAISDKNAILFLLDADVTDQELGLAVLAALDESTFMSPRGFPSADAFLHAFYDGRKQSNLGPEPWIAPAMKKFGYTSERSFMRPIWNFSIQRSEGKIQMDPRHKIPYGGWGGGPTARDVSEHTPDDTEPERLGILFRRCLEKCTA